MNIDADHLKRYLEDPEHCPFCGKEEPLVEKDGLIFTVSCDYCDREFAYFDRTAKGQEKPNL